MQNRSEPLNLLVIEDNPGDYILLEKYIQKTRVKFGQILWAKSLEEADTIIQNSTVDLSFLDLSLPDSQGISSFESLNSKLPHVPIIVLSGLSNTDVALETIALGAQDYLIKGEFDEKLLLRCIQYSSERKKILENLRESNERFEIVNKATLDIIWDWNLTTNDLFMSSSVQQILGYIDQNVSIEWFFERVHPEYAESVRESLFGALESGKNHWVAEFLFMVPDGSYRSIYSRGYTLFNADGRPGRMIGAATDLTEKRKLEKELVEHQLNQQKLITETTIWAQEKERNELARELHDNINQVLSSVKMFLNIAKEDASVREDLVNRCYNNVSYAIEEIRKLSQSLVAPSLGDMGIVEALQELSDEINITRGLKVDLNCGKWSGKKLDKSIELMLYRIAQEQMNNVIKYARASTTLITLSAENERIYMSIADDGIGFDPAEKPRGIGLKNISSRVKFYSGTLNIITAPGKGCRLEIDIPV